MEAVLNKDAAAWEAWLTKNGGCFAFLQSSGWAGGLRAAGRRVDLVEVQESGVVVAEALLDVRTERFVRYAFCPKGPTIAPGVDKEKVITVLCAYAAKERSAFLRIEPAENSVGTLVRDINPPATLLLNLEPSVEELLTSMHAKTRYNIRLAERHGVAVSVEKNFGIFWELLKKTGSRDNFGLHPQRTYEAIVALPNVELLVARVNSTPVAAGCFIRFGSTVSYLYGASDHDYRESMAPHLVQWTAILRAKAAGAAMYDFFGISPKGVAGEWPVKEHIYNEVHRYAGVTRFKLGFGGTVHEDPGTFDVVINRPRYTLYRLARSVSGVIKKICR